MTFKKPLFFLLPLFGLVACAQKEKTPIVSKWKYERIEASNPKTSVDTAMHVLTEMIYEGSVLEFKNNDSFVITNKDAQSDFQGKGTYFYNAKNNTLTMHGGVKATAEDQRKVEVKELTSDSLKMGNANEQVIYSRIKR